MLGSECSKCQVKSSLSLCGSFFGLLPRPLQNTESFRMYVFVYGFSGLTKATGGVAEGKLP
jgi:hypothetical protein